MSEMAIGSTEGHDLGGGHWWLWLDDGDGLWKHPACRSWRRIDLTSGERHRLRTGSPSTPMVMVTIDGSLLCTDCGAHGFVVNGRWRDA